MEPVTGAAVGAAVATAGAKCINATDKLLNTINNMLGGKAREIRQIANANAEAMVVTAEAESKVAMIKAQGAENVAQFVLAKESRKMQNTLSVVEKAEQLINPADMASEESVNQDWVNRFFTIVEDISDDEMQKIWAQILAGEVKEPRSYSLRTLDVLRNMTQEDAKLFGEAIKYVFNNKYLCTENFSLSLIDRLKLEDLGLVNSNDLSKTETINSKGVSQITYMNSIVLELHNDSDSTIKATYNLHTLTSAGIQLLRLGSNIVDDVFLSEFAKFIKSKSVNRVTKHSAADYNNKGNIEQYHKQGVEI